MLGEGYMDVSFEALGPEVVARVRPAAVPDRPVALVAEGVWIGSVPVPQLLANWFIRTVDPSAAIANRLPFVVVVRPVTVGPAAVRVGG